MVDRDYADVIQQRATVLKALRGVLRDEIDLFGSPVIGPQDWKRISYPAAQLLPQSTQYQDGHRYQHTVYTLLAWRRGKATDYITDILEPTGSVIEGGMAALRDTDGVVQYVPSQVEDFTGQIPGSSAENAAVLAVAIQWDVTTAVDLSDTEA